MGRNCIRRHIHEAPSIKGLRPFGKMGGARKSVVMTLDEYEVIRLLDYQNLTQEEAAVSMQISRPTLTRIYEKARHIFATALVEGCEIQIGGGDVQMHNHLYHCNACRQKIQSEEATIATCPQCNSSEIHSLDDCHQKKCKQCRKCNRGGRNATS